MDFTTLTIEALKFFANIVGNWGVAIIILTIIIRVLLWPFNVSQQRSMKKMQTLQPKLKTIQDRYKSNPEEMQRKMMEFYKENKFNPMAGCLPLLLQLPVFILLYTALMSPQFIALAGKTNFLFVSRLDATIKSNAGVSFDGKFAAGKYDKFATDKTAVVYLKNGEVLDNVKISQPMKAVEIQGELDPGKPVDFKISLDSLNLKFSQLDSIEKAEINILDPATKETEKVDFTRSGNLLTASVPTIVVKEKIHYDVIFLVLLFGLTMWLSTKVMTAANKNQPQDPTQQALQKSMGTFMPIMIVATFIFIPIPAGVLLYLVTSNVFQIAQTVIINKQLEKEDEKNGIKPESSNAEAKKNAAKEIKDVEK